MPDHPLAALSAAEVERAAALLKPHLGARAAFSSVALAEPPKAFVQSFKAGEATVRRLRFIGYDHPQSADGGFDATVDLGSGEVRVERIAAGQAPIGFADVVEAVRVTKADAGSSSTAHGVTSTSQTLYRRRCCAWRRTGRTGSAAWSRWTGTESRAASGPTQ